MSVELRGCLVQRLPQQQTPVGGTSVPNLDHNKQIHAKAIPLRNTYLKRQN